MSNNIQITINNKDDIAVISIRGDVTATNKKLIYDAFQNDTVANSPKILLKFDKSCFIDSAGRATLIDIAIEGCKKGQKINICGLSNHFQKIFDLIGLTKCIFIFSSEDAAFTHLSK